jgi:hypothetical protein
MHIQHILSRLVIIDDLRPFYNATGPKIAAGLQSQHFAHVSPFHEVCGGVAVDGLEGAAVELVFAEEVVGVTDCDDAGAVRLDVLAVGGRPTTAGNLVLDQLPYYIGMEEPWLLRFARWQ